MYANKAKENGRMFTYIYLNYKGQVRLFFSFTHYTRIYTYNVTNVNYKCYNFYKL